MKTPNFLALFLLLGFTAQAQVGINTLEPDTTAILHIHSDNKGVLLPILDTAARRGLRAVAADGLLVYDSIHKIYYFVNKTEEVHWRWYALNPFQTTDENDPNGNRDNVRLASRFQNRNVVIGQGNADTNAKLHVKGNIKSDDTVFAKHVCIESKIIAETARIFDSLWSKKIESVSLRTTVAKIDTIRTSIVIADTIHSSAIHSRSLVPIGTIVMWTPLTGIGGSLNRAVVPECWEEVRELRGRFPIGAGIADDGHGGVYQARSVQDHNQRQGQAFVTLTTEQIPNHTHNVPAVQWNHHPVGHSMDGRLTTGSGAMLVSFDAGITSSGVNSPEGTNHPHENRPPFYGVYFIRKISNNCP
jgi:microcystin-dependent protein